MRLIIVSLILFLTGCESLLTNDMAGLTQYNLSTYLSKVKAQIKYDDILEIRVKPMGAGLSSNRVYSIDEKFRVEPIAQVRWIEPLDELVSYHLTRVISDTKQFQLVTTRPGELVTDRVLVLELQEFYLRLKSGNADQVSIRLQGYLIDKKGKGQLKSFIIVSNRGVKTSSISGTMETFRLVFDEVQQELLGQLEKIVD